MLQPYHGPQQRARAATAGMKDMLTKATGEMCVRYLRTFPCGCQQTGNVYTFIDVYDSALRRAFRAFSIGPSHTPAQKRAAAATTAPAPDAEPPVSRRLFLWALASLAKSTPPQ